MDFRQLRYALSISKERSFTKAATKQRRTDMAKTPNNSPLMIDRGEGCEKMLRGEHRPQMR